MLAKYRCSVSCSDGLESSGHFGGVPQSLQCWGLLRVWCTTNTSSTPTQFWGLKCHGHYRSGQFSSAPAELEYLSEHVTIAGQRKQYVMCEGGHAWFSGETGVSHETGEAVTRLEGFWSVGSYVGIMTSFNKTHGDSSDGVGESHSELLGVQEAGKDEDAQQEGLLERARSLLAMSRGAADSSSSRGAGFIKAGGTATAQQQAQQQQQQAQVSAPPAFSYEGRAEGLSGKWKAVKREGAVMDTLHGMGHWSVDEVEEEVKGWLSSSAPARKLGDAGSDHGRLAPQHGDWTGDATLLCNDKDAWWHGQFPCWGNLTLRVHASNTPDASAEVAQPASSTAGGSGGRTTFSMQGTCGGFWSGWFGHTCYGLSTQHSKVVYVGADGDAITVDEHNICSLRDTISPIKMKGVEGMSTMCKGHSVTAMTIQM